MRNTQLGDTIRVLTDRQHIDTLRLLGMLKNYSFRSREHSDHLVLRRIVVTRTECNGKRISSFNLRQLDAVSCGAGLGGGRAFCADHPCGRVHVDIVRLSDNVPAFDYRGWHSLQGAEDELFQGGGTAGGCDDRRARAGIRGDIRLGQRPGLGLLCHGLSSDHLPPRDGSPTPHHLLLRIIITPVMLHTPYNYLPLVILQRQPCLFPFILISLH